MVGGLSKNVYHHDWVTTKKKNNNNTGWNALKMSPKKRTLDQNINYSKSHIWNSFFENIILGIQIFFIRPHVPVDMIRVFSYFRFSSRKSQSQQKLVKKDHTFYNKVLLKNTHSFYETQLTWHWKRYVPATQPKTFLTLQIFQQTCFRLVSKKKKHLHCTISWSPRTAFKK